MVRLALLVSAAMIAFAANSVLARLALGSGGISAAGYTGVRLAAGALTLAGLVGVGGRKLDLGAAVRSGRRWAAALALFTYAIAFSFAYLLLGAGTGALVLFASVQFGILGWAIVRGERPGVMALVGLAVALAAFAYLVSPGLTAPNPLGAVLMVAAGLAWAVYTMLGRGSAEPLRDSAQNFALTLPLALPLAVSLIWTEASLAALIWAIASGALASGIGYAVWYAALPKLSRVRAGIVQLSVPALAAFGGIAFIGEAMTWRLGIASLLIIGGVAMALVARDRPKPSGRPSST